MGSELIETRPPSVAGAARRRRQRLSVDASGERLRGARWCASPNHDARPVADDISLLVIHAISLPPEHFTGGAVEALFTNRLAPDSHPSFASLRDLRVSAHLFLRRAGALVQFVPLRARAWHAGLSSFEGRSRCNDFSIGIELEGSDHRPFTPTQYRRLAQVTHALMAAFPAITPDRIVGHSDIAPGRKTDPGPHFDWPSFRSLL
jgi:N-acetyl-anhydromuramoyl-L-alanine amidase